MKVLTIDVGGVLTRIMLITYSNGRFTKPIEISSFESETVFENGHTRWNMPVIIANIKAGIHFALTSHKDISSIGITGFGVDYVYIDNDGKLLFNPICFRDERNQKAMEQTLNVLDFTALYQRTGIQKLPYNTIFQLFDDYKYNKSLLKNVDRMLMISDYVAFTLTGKRRLEITNACTSGLVSLNTRKISGTLLNDLGIDDTIFSNIVNPGELYGYLKEELNIHGTGRNIPVYAVCSHNTSSAFLGTPLEEKGVVIFTGNVATVGTELETFNTSPYAMQYNFSNEMGYRKINFLKNTMGGYILNELKKAAEEQGLTLDDAEIARLIDDAPESSYVIDVDDPLFAYPSNAKFKMIRYLKSSGQSCPVFDGQWLITVLKSMALRYRYTIDQLKLLTKIEFNTINVVGNVAGIDYLNQQIANFTGLKVIRGPIEAASIGSAIVQLIASGQIKDENEGRKIVRNSFKLTSFTPDEDKDYEKEYQEFLKIVGLQTN